MAAYLEHFLEKPPRRKLADSVARVHFCGNRDRVRLYPGDLQSDRYHVRRVRRVRLLPLKRVCCLGHFFCADQML